MSGSALAFCDIQYFFMTTVCGNITYSSWQLNPP